MAVIAYIFNAVADLYILVIFVMVILSWLISFNVVNGRNRFVDAVNRTTIALTEPLLAPIRRFMPNLGGIDLSPIVLLILVNAVRLGMNRYVFGPLINSGL